MFNDEIITIIKAASVQRMCFSFIKTIILAIRYLQLLAESRAKLREPIYLFDCKSIQYSLLSG